MALESKRKVVSLVRVSTDKQKKDADVDYQRNQINMTAHHFKLDVVQEFSLEGISGLNVHKTSEFRDLKRMVARKDIHGLVIPGIDRLARTTEFRAVADLMDPFAELMGDSNSKRLWSLNDELDITSHADRIKIWDGLKRAADERDLFRWRTMSQKDVMRLDPTTKVDKLPKGIIPVPIPGKKKRYTFEYDPVVKAKIAEACNRVLAGEALSDIALDLGYRSGNGMRETLRSEWWIGFKTRLRTTKPRKWDEEKQQYFVGGHIPHQNPIRVRTTLADDPAVSVEVWDAVQVKLNENVKHWTQRKSHSKQFLATGLVHCGKCGEKMYHKKQDGRKHLGYYWCGSKAKSYRKYLMKQSTDCGFGFVRADRLEDEINLQITLYLTDKNSIDASIRESMNAEATEEKKRSLVRVEQDIATLEDEKRRMLTAIKKGIASADDFAEDMKDCNFRIDQQKQKAEFLKAEINTSISSETLAQMASQIAAEFANFPYMPFERKLALVKKYVKKIVVKKNEVTDEMTLHFTVKPGKPPVYEPSTDPTSTKQKKKVVVNTKEPIRVVEGGTIGGVPATPKRSKTEGRSTSSS